MMERGSSSSNVLQEGYRSRGHASMMNSQANRNGNDGDDNSSDQQQQLPAAAPRASIVTREHDQQQHLPIANVIRIMRRVLPLHVKISDDAKETVQECVSEYISFITAEANDRCRREQRRTVTAEDVLWAMAKLGFDDYVDPLTLFIKRYREAERDRTAIRERGAAVGAGEIYRDPHGASSSSSSSQKQQQPSYDPFAQFKRR